MVAGTAYLHPDYWSSKGASFHVSVICDSDGLLPHCVDVAKNGDDGCAHHHCLHCCCCSCRSLASGGDAIAPAPSCHGLIKSTKNQSCSCFAKFSRHNRVSATTSLCGGLMIHYLRDDVGSAASALFASSPLKSSESEFDELQKLTAEFSLLTLLFVSPGTPPAPD